MEHLDTAFSALADPTRRAILARLAQGEATVLELAKPFELSQPTISQHLKVLEKAGLITRRIEGTKRPCRLAKEGVDAIDQWLSMLRKAFEQNYNRLDAVLAQMKTEKGGKDHEQDDTDNRGRSLHRGDKAVRRPTRSRVPRPH